MILRTIRIIVFMLLFASTVFAQQTVPFLPHHNISNGSAISLVKDFYSPANIAQQRLPGSMLTSNRINKKPAAGVYLPVTVTSDTSRYTCQYDAKGNPLMELYENRGLAGWENEARSTYTYTASGRIESRVLENWNGTNWIGNYRITYSWDGSGYFYRMLEEVWKNNTWVNSYRNTCEYVGGPELMVYLLETWNNDRWEKASRSTFTASSNGYLLSGFMERWGATTVSDTGWTLTNRMTFSYDSEWHQLEYLNEEKNGDTWEISTRNSYTYDSNGNPLTYYYENWVGNVLYSTSKNTFTYDSNGNTITELYEYWQRNSAIGAVRNTYSYDGFGNRIRDVQEYLDNTTWVPSHASEYVYDSHGNAIEGRYFTWQNNNWVHAFGYLNMYYANNRLYTTINGRSAAAAYHYFTTGIAEWSNEPKQFSLNQNYPNPFNPSTEIQYQLSESGMVSLKVYDVLGKEVTTLVQQLQRAGSYSVTFHAGSLPTGIYYYQLQAGTQVATKKLMLLK